MRGEDENLHVLICEKWLEARKEVCECQDFDVNLRDRSLIFIHLFKAME